jgi:DNA-binding response OmpR family regulator
MEEASKTDPISYLSKPHRDSELQSNILIAIRSIKQNTLQNLGNDNMYDASTATLYHNEVPIVLGSNEQRLFNKLLDSKGTVVSLNILEEYIWGIAPSESSLRNLVNRVNTKLKKLKIENVRSLGYKLAFNT